MRYTTQTAFNKMVTHLRLQGKKSRVKVNGKYECRYRDGKGNMCAVGCLIPNKYYRPEIEVFGGYSTAWCCEDVQKNVPSLRNVDLDVLYRMQEVHDTYPPRNWEKQFSLVAEHYELTLPKQPKRDTDDVK